MVYERRETVKENNEIKSYYHYLFLEILKEK